MESSENKIEQHLFNGDSAEVLKTLKRGVPEEEVAVAEEA